MINNTNILIDPNDILRKKCDLVQFPLSKEDSKLVEELRQYVVLSNDEDECNNLNISPAVGIAAPQVGITKQICIVYIKYNEKEIDDLILINPKIIAHSVEKTFLEGGEACLSIKDEHPGLVHRHAYVEIEYQNIKGTTKTLEANGFTAVAIQHEIDHLNGILFYDHFDKNDSMKIISNSYPL